MTKGCQCFYHLPQDLIVELIFPLDLVLVFALLLVTENKNEQFTLVYSENSDFMLTNIMKNRIKK